MLQIIITAIVTFVITTIWASYSYGRGNKNILISFEALKNELDYLSKELGYKDATEYWKKIKGQQYSETRLQNIENATKFLKNK